MEEERVEVEVLRNLRVGGERDKKRREEKGKS